MLIQICPWCFPWYFSLFIYPLLSSFSFMNSLYSKTHYVIYSWFKNASISQHWSLKLHLVGKILALMDANIVIHIYGSLLLLKITLAVSTIIIISLLSASELSNLSINISLFLYHILLSFSAMNILTFSSFSISDPSKPLSMSVQNKR